jgi:lariat debranching enzyme
MQRTVNIAVQGCSHGELDTIYQSIRDTECRTGKKLDLLLLCGDLQCVRDAFDLQCVAVPPKYRKLNTFHQYVTGEKQSPVMTVFVGGNHEASNILQSLYLGGFVAPNIYFLGFAGVINFKGLRIAGVSGIYNDRHYHCGHYETPPYSEDALRSVYHLREIEALRLEFLKFSSKPVDIFLSHDWPQNIWNYGKKEELLRIKPYFQEDIASGKLGSPPLNRLLMTLQPSFWFCAHLHVKFPAVVPHSTGSSESKTTRFLALDKVIPGRYFHSWSSRFRDFVLIPPIILGDLCNI